jgi:DNA-binding transcriptional regulator YiaG
MGRAHESRSYLTADVRNPSPATSCIRQIAGPGQRGLSLCMSRFIRYFTPLRIPYIIPSGRDSRIVHAVVDSVHKVFSVTIIRLIASKGVIMSNIATVLKQEITRLARKEAKAQTAALHKANAHYRRDIARLKRQAIELSKQVSFLENQERRRAAKGAPKANVEGRRFSSRGLKAHREKIGLSASDYARLVGVTGQTIYNWEGGKSRPREEQLSSLLAVKEQGAREARKRLELLNG